MHGRRAQADPRTTASSTASETTAITQYGPIARLPQDVFVADGDGYALLVGPMCERYYGVAASEIIGRHVLELERDHIFRPAVTPKVLRARAIVMEEQITRTGRKLEVTGIPIFAQNGKVGLVLCLSRDVTEQRISAERTSHQSEQGDVGCTSQIGTGLPASIVYKSNAMKLVVAQAQIAAKSDCTVLVLGETGVGKDLVARTIHSLSGRAPKPFVKVNCATIPEPLLESELFGYAPGAFTGCDRRGKLGIFALARGGTVFLDEVGELSLAAQAKLLQVVEERRFRPLGSQQETEVDVRLVAATNRDLSRLVNEGKFRADLYYRLRVFTITVPPLRDRPEDIEALAMHFLSKYNAKYGTKRHFSDSALALLVRYSWPGNVRELDHLVERLVLQNPRHGTIGEDEIRAALDTPEPALGSSRGITTLREAKARLEEQLVREAYARLGSSYKVARALGISQTAAYKKIRRLLETSTAGSHITRH